MKKIKRELSLALSSRLNTKFVHTFSTGFLLFGHIGYLIAFFIFKIYPMAFLNVFSVCFYTVMLLMNMRTEQYSNVLLLEEIEIMVHSLAGTYYIGWDAGFALFFIGNASIPFFGNFRKHLTPFVIAGLNMIAFIAARINLYNWAAPYHLNKTYLMNGLYIYNALASFFIVIFISSYSIFMREMMADNMKKKNEHLQRLATIDPLTQLFNRRAMMEYIKLIEKNSRKSNESYSLCISDIDDFKKINDTYGHDAGDEVLKTVSSIFVSIVPTEGYVCRWGGEEILFALPTGGGYAAVIAAEKIRKEIEAHRFDIDGRQFTVTMTFGVCKVKPDENYDSGISRADKFLYEGKHAGKNRVITE